MFRIKDNVDHLAVEGRGIVTRAHYDKETKTFITSDDRSFETLDELKSELQGNLSDCDFSDYDFKGIEITPEMVDNCVIDSRILVKRGLYDDSFYRANFKFKYGEGKSLVVSEKAPVVKNEEGDYTFKPIVCYISDLHLDDKIADRFPKRATKMEVESFIGEIVDSLIEHGFNRFKCFLIGGDVSHNYIFCEMFYRLMGKKKCTVLAVMGNHEYWGYNINVPKDVDRFEYVRKTYQKMFEQNGIFFLDNSLFYKNHHEDGGNIITEEELTKMTIDEIRKKTVEADTIVFGGTGFTGLEPKYNGEMGLYRETIDRRKDIELSSKIDTLYRKLSAIDDLEIICLTHMPKESWTSADYNDSWFYVDGHTHNNKNRYYGKKRTYSDNQVGYKGKYFRMKMFLLTGVVDIFRYHPDGIHYIDEYDYRRFYYYLGQNMTYNRSKTVIMMKNSGFYAFFYQSDKGYHILDGGLKRTTLGHDLNWIYHRIPLQGGEIITKLEPFMKYISKVAKSVKSFGGLGRIHGSIVDITAFDHLYVNPHDGKITPYYATDIVNKKFYPDIRSLLEEECPHLLRGYDREEKKNSDFLPAVVDGVGDSGYYYETDIYGPSRIIKKMQYVYEFGIVRVWNNELDLIDVDDNSNVEIFNELADQGESPNENEDGSYRVSFALNVFEAMEIIDWCIFARGITQSLGESKSDYYRYRDDDYKFISMKYRKLFRMSTKFTFNNDYSDEVAKFAVDHYRNTTKDGRADYLKNYFFVTNEEIDKFDGKMPQPYDPRCNYLKIRQLYVSEPNLLMPLWKEIVRVCYLGASKKPYSEEHIDAYINDEAYNSDGNNPLQLHKYDTYDRSYNPLPDFESGSCESGTYKFWEIFDITIDSLINLVKKTNGKYDNQGKTHNALIIQRYPELYKGTGIILERELVKNYVLIKYRDKQPESYCKIKDYVVFCIDRVVDLIYDGQYNPGKNMTENKSLLSPRDRFLAITRRKRLF